MEDEGFNSKEKSEKESHFREKDRNLKSSLFETIIHRREAETTERDFSMSLTPALRKSFQDTEEEEREEEGVIILYSISLHRNSHTSFGFRERKGMKGQGFLGRFAFASHLFFFVHCGQRLICFHVFFSSCQVMLLAGSSA